MACMAAARSAVRSSGRGSRVAAGAVRSNPTTSQFRVLDQTQNRLSHPNPNSLRSAMAMSRRLGSMLPYHTATASSLLTSMLSVSDRHFLWTHQDGP